MNQIKAVIFDLDGTLANTLPLCISAFRKSIEPLINREVSDEEIIATFGPSEEGTIMALAPDGYDKGVANYLKFYEELHQMCTDPFVGIKEILTNLQQKGIKISMVTGKGRKSAMISLDKFGLTHFFEQIETGLPSGPSKAQGIQNILDTLTNIEKNEVIYVGDVPSDVIASRKVGIPIVAAAWAETAEPEKLIAMEPNQLFYTIEEFSNWLTEHTH